MFNIGDRVKLIEKAADLEKCGCSACTTLRTGGYGTIADINESAITVNITGKDEKVASILPVNYNFRELKLLTPKEPDWGV